MAASTMAATAVTTTGIVMAAATAAVTTTAVSAAPVSAAIVTAAAVTTSVTAAPERQEKAKAAAALLGNLNAAHASATARQNAAPNSMVGKIAAYETAMREALSKSSASTTTSTATPVSGTALTREEFDAKAREQLGAIANKPVTEETVTQVNALLGIDPSTLQSAPAPAAGTTASTAAAGTATR